jgi:polyhydroxyalkanoate depolymerase
MIYQMYQAQCDALAPLRAMASIGRAALGATAAGNALQNAFTRGTSAGYEMLARSGLTHARPPFGIASVRPAGAAEDVAVSEEAADVTPFATLLHFKKAGTAGQPRVLIVAPLSGHFSTLLRGTVRTMLADNDVYLTDWHNARDVPLRDGAFGVDGYVDHVIRFLEKIGPGAHVVAVCQPAVAVLVAVAVMAEGQNPATPRSMTLMAGPIDTRQSPTSVNDLAKSKPIEWFEQKLIDRVPYRYRGAGRLVYPGFLQCMAFLNMNLDRHLSAHREMFRNLMDGEEAKAAATRTFYDEYFAVLDLTAEFYLETVRLVFQEHALPLGRMEFHGRRVDPAAIGRTALLTVEGEKDDICGIGQTMAAHELCPGIKPFRKKHHLQAGVGHYGVFNGKRWDAQIYPVVNNMILAND